MCYITISVKINFDVEEKRKISGNSDVEINLKNEK